ncbi:MAG TPA: hypothetical protein VGL94_02085, partial [Ktedonobacteraceae bacterium]
MQYRDLLSRIHARQSMFTRSISDECVEHIIDHGEPVSHELRNEMTISKQTIRTKEYLSRVKAKKVKRREERREKKRSELRGGA